MLSNAQNSFQNSCAIETGLSDFHKMAAKVMKMKFEKLKHRIVHSRDYKTFFDDTFGEYLLSKFSMENISPSEYSLRKFLGICVSALDRFAPCKKNFVRGNNIDFINRNLKKALMKRKRLRNNFLKYRSSTGKTAYNNSEIIVFFNKKVKRTIFLI